MTTRLLIAFFGAIIILSGQAVLPEASSGTAPDNYANVKFGGGAKTLNNCLVWDQYGRAVSATCGAETASNVGTGIGVFKSKVALDLQFKSLLSGSTKLTIVSGTNEVTLDVVPSTILLSTLGGSLGLTQIAQGAATTGQILQWNGTNWIPASVGGGPANTDELAEGAVNLYHTTARARTALSVTGILGYNNGTGVISCANCADISSSYANPAWIFSLAYAKITGVPAFQLTSEKAAANGYASLGASTLVPVNQLGSGIADNTVFLRGDGTWANPAGGDFSSNTAVAVDSEIVVFNGTTGKSGKRATGTGVAHLTAGVLGVATVTVPNGGTGVATLTDRGVLVGRATGAVEATAVGTAGQLLTSNGAGVSPTFQTAAAAGDFSSNTATSVDSEVVIFSGTAGKSGKRATGTGVAHLTAGVLSVAVVTVPNGGTGVATLTDRGVVVGRGTGAVAVTAVGTAGQILTSNGAGVDPSFQTAAVGGDFSSNTATSVDSELVLFSGTAGKTGKRATGTGVAHLTSGVLGVATVTVPNGGTGVATLTDRGVLVGRAAGAVEATAVGTAGQVLTSNGTGVNPTFQTAAAAGDFSSNTATSVDSELVLFSGTAGKTGKRATGTGVAKLTAGVLSASTVVVGEGGTGVATLTDRGVVVGRGTAAVAVTAVGTAGQILTSNGAGVDPSFQTAAVGGDFSSNTATSVDTEIVVFNGTTGKSGKRATGTGVAHLTAGVLGVAVVTVPNGGTGVATLTGIAKGNGTSAFTRATAQDTSAVNYVAGGGTAQVQTATLSPAITAQAAGQTVAWLPIAANTGAGPTLAVNGLTALTITKLGATALVAGDITTTAVAIAVLIGTNWQLQNPQVVGGSGTVTSVGWTGGIVSVATATTTPALTVAGTSGGIPYFSGAATWASSAALAANGVLIGGGAGATPTSIAASTTTTQALFATAGAPAFRAVVSGDIPTLNQNTTGSAATLTTTRAIYGNNFDGSAALTQVIGSAFGGTGNGFTAFAGPATTQKIFTLPDAAATILTSNAAVTVAQGGTGVATLTDRGVVVGRGTAAVAVTAVGTAGQILTSNGAGVDPSFQTAAAAAAGTLTGATLAAGVTGSSLTSVGTLSAGAVPASLVTSGTFGAGAYTIGALTGTGSISDVLGNVRDVPPNARTAAYTLVIGDAGKHISITTGGVTIPASVFSVGQAITIYNNSASSQTITQGASVTLRLAGTATTGNRTLALRGLATLLCVATNEFVISGGGLT